MLAAIEAPIDTQSRCADIGACVMAPFYTTTPDIGFHVGGILAAIQPGAVLRALQNVDTRLFKQMGKIGRIDDREVSIGVRVAHAAARKVAMIRSAGLRALVGLLSPANAMCFVGHDVVIAWAKWFEFPAQSTGQRLWLHAVSPFCDPCLWRSEMTQNLDRRVASPQSGAFNQCDNEGSLRESGLDRRIRESSVYARQRDSRSGFARAAFRWHCSDQACGRVPYRDYPMRINETTNGHRCSPERPYDQSEDQLATSDVNVPFSNL
jgi:hypothetical protein